MMVAGLVSIVWFNWDTTQADSPIQPLGPGHVLGIAQGIHSQRVKFYKSVTLAFFAGEEQGLLGSSAYARQSSNA